MEQNKNHAETGSGAEWFENATASVGAIAAISGMCTTAAGKRNLHASW